MPEDEVRETVFGSGHPNVQGTHKATFEFTKDAHLSKNGDCILAVSADKGLNDLSFEFKKAVKKPCAKVTLIIEAGGVSETVQASGGPNLTLTHETEMVVRKGEFISDRTLAVHADKAANDFSRKLVEKLKNPNQKVKITLIAKV